MVFGLIVDNTCHDIHQVLSINSWVQQAAEHKKLNILALNNMVNFNGPA